MDNSPLANNENTPSTSQSVLNSPPMAMRNAGLIGAASRRRKRLHQQAHEDRLAQEKSRPPASAAAVDAAAAWLQQLQGMAPIGLSPDDARALLALRTQAAAAECDAADDEGDALLLPSSSDVVEGKDSQYDRRSTRTEGAERVCDCASISSVRGELVERYDEIDYPHGAPPLNGGRDRPDDLLVLSVSVSPEFQVVNEVAIQLD
ncbi:hypothetical protein AB1Y20_001005 [Prymnesium parvum]|uniref:Snurportin-1 n=1 Tax=Prymnesium parvum TaxID=97485 RepID=A0AB34KAE1_PRYPA